MQLPDSLAERLLGWYAAGHRALPWRQDHEPYHVWLSEIMLQQTRVEAVKGYYARFLSELPDIAALAACEENRLTKLWEGLGYYSRVRNLQKAARVIMVQHGGAFPRKYAEIRALPGVGDYTAGAVASICFDVPEPAVDGNVLRVLSRVTQDTAPVTRPAVKKAYETALRPVYAANPGKRSELTQALMELGACVCVPNGAPKCDACPLRTVCLAEKERRVGFAPPSRRQKSPAASKKRRSSFFNAAGSTPCASGPRRVCFAGLWELPNVEGTLDAQQALALLDSWGLVPEELTRTRERTHIFTHVEWRMRCYDIRVSMPADSFTWVSGTRFQQDIALPTAFRIFWQPEDAE